MSEERGPECGCRSALGSKTKYAATGERPWSVSIPQDWSWEGNYFLSIRLISSQDLRYDISSRTHQIHLLCKPEWSANGGPHAKLQLHTFPSVCYLDALISTIEKSEHASENFTLTQEREREQAYPRGRTAHRRCPINTWGNERKITVEKEVTGQQVCNWPV